MRWPQKAGRTELYFFNLGPYDLALIADQNDEDAKMNSRGHSLPEQED